MTSEEHKHTEDGKIIPPPTILYKLQQPLENPIDPLCQNEKYRKNRNPWCVDVKHLSKLNIEKRAEYTPQEIQQKYEEYQKNEWNNKSRCNKIFTILYYLPIHLYRKYLSSIDYRQYYNGLYWFVSNNKVKKNE